MAEPGHLTVKVTKGQALLIPKKYPTNFLVPHLKEVNSKGSLNIGREFLT